MSLFNRVLFASFDLKSGNITLKYSTPTPAQTPTATPTQTQTQTTQLKNDSIPVQFKLL